MTHDWNDEHCSRCTKPFEDCECPIPKAFHRYLLSLPRDEAVLHLYDCLATGDAKNNEAWKLLEEIHGESWAFKVGQVMSFLTLTIDKLASRPV
jgi:hypothetical protein